jgi:hypothetical protein
MKKQRGHIKRVFSISIMIVSLTSAAGAVRADSAARDTASPSITFVGISDVTSTTATIHWSTDTASDSQVQYGTTISYGNLTALDPTLVINHVQMLTGLTPGTVYHFWVLSRDATGSIAPSRDYQFMTITSPNRPAPVISSVTITDVSSSTATISWVTDLLSDSQVQYGLTASYGTATPLDPTPVAVHSRTLSNLRALTTYHFQVSSRDVYGHLGTSIDLTFTTLAGPPTISGISTTAITFHGATISWITDLPASSQLAYGTTPACNLLSALDTTMKTFHTQRLEGLDLGTTYYFRVQSKSANGYSAISNVGTFGTVAIQPAELIIPRLVTIAGSDTAGIDDSLYTGIAMSNLGPQAAELSFSAYDAWGTLIAGDNIINPAKRLLPSGGQLAVTDVELFGTGLAAAQPIGWIDIASSTNTVTGFTTFFNRSGSLVDGSPVLDTPTTAFVFPELDEEGSTMFFVANPSAALANIQLALFTSDGTVRSFTARNIAPFGALVESVLSLFPDAVPQVSDYVSVFSDVNVAANEMLGGPSHDAASLNGIDQNTGGATTLYCPQYVVGGQYRSTLSIVNLGTADGNVSISLIRDDGVQIGQTKTLPIKASGKIYISDPAFFSLNAGFTISGYLVVVSDGPGIAGSVVFEGSALSKFKTALPLVSQLDVSLVFSDVVSNTNYFTGMALLNPNNDDAIVTIELYRADGSLYTSASLTIPAHQRISEVLTQMFPDTATQSINSGYIRVSANRGVAGFSVFGTNDMKVISAVPAQVVR